MAHAAIFPKRIQVHNFPAAALAFISLSIRQMEQHQHIHPGDRPNGSEVVGTIPHDAEGFGKVPNDSESFRTIPHGSERRESHTLTVREVARRFEAAGVARTERSITNWCQANRSGVARLDSYFDPNERKYFITLQSVELAVAEEKAKATKPSQDISEPFERFRASENTKTVTLRQRRLRKKAQKH